MLGFVSPDREGSGAGSGLLGFWMTSLYACISHLILDLKLVQSLRNKEQNAVILITSLSNMQFLSSTC